MAKGRIQSLNGRHFPIAGERRRSLIPKVRLEHTRVLPHRILSPARHRTISICLVSRSCCKPSKIGRILRATCVIALVLYWSRIANAVIKMLPEAGSNAKLLDQRHRTRPALHPPEFLSLHRRHEWLKASTSPTATTSSTTLRPSRAYQRAWLISCSSATAVSSPDLIFPLCSSREPVSGGYVANGRIPRIFITESLALSTSRASPASESRSRNASMSESVTRPTRFMSGSYPDCRA